MTKPSPYFELLKSPRWQEKRLEIMNRDQFTCLECGDKTKTKQLTVHHRYYIKGREPGNYPSWALVTLCKDCHKIEQELAGSEFSRFEWLLSFLSYGGNPEVLDQVFELVDDIRCARPESDMGSLFLSALEKLSPRSKSKTRKP